MNNLALYSNKGGVGKTASAVNLAYAFARAGQRTLLCDLDPQGASSFYFRVKPSKKLKDDAFFKDSDRLLKSIRASDFEGLDLLPANFSFRDFDLFLAGMKNPRSRLRKALKALKGDYDLIILDCPPNISRLSEAVFKSADLILVPVIPTTLSERTFEQLLEFFRQEKFDTAKIRPFFSMVQRTKSLHKDTMERLRQTHAGFCETIIPFSADIEKMGLQRAPVGAYAASRQAAKAYDDLFLEVSTAHLR